MSSPDSTTAGDTCSLTCSATLSPRNPSLPDSNIPAPTFEWFFGPNGNASLPSGLTPTETYLSNNSYRSTLHFSPLSQFHTGRYTCRLGVGSLINSAMVTVNGIAIIVYNIERHYKLNSLSFQHLPSLSRSLLMELWCWDKMATPSHVVLMELKISIPQ